MRYQFKFLDIVIYKPTGEEMVVIEVNGDTITCKTEGGELSAPASQFQLKMTDRKALRILHEAQKWRRGAKNDMPNPALFGLAIDHAIRTLRYKIRNNY